MSSPLQKAPLYVQVRDALAARIATGVWKPGAVLPSEQDLAREFGVSSGTMRKALDQLEQDHLVTRKQGHGTFVIDQAEPENAFRFSNLRDKNGGRIVDFKSELLSQSIGLADAQEQEHLRIGPDDKVVRTRRLRKHEGRPFMLEDSTLALSRFPGLRDSEVGSYTVTVLAQQQGVHLSRGCENLAIAMATPEIAGLLSVPSGTPLLRLERLIYAQDDGPVERRIGLCHLQGEHYLAEMR